MRRILSIIAVGVSFTLLGTPNLIKDSDCNTTPLASEFGQRGIAQSKLTRYIEDLTWNNCLKFELTKYQIDLKGKKFVNTDLRIGGNSKIQGFICKPNTTYKFSFELKGDAQRCMVNFFEWSHEKDNFKGCVKKRTSIHLVKVQKDWTKYEGTFRTSSSAKRAALCIQFWGNDSTEKIGQYILVDKINVFEDLPKITSLEIKPFSFKDILPSKVCIIGNSKSNAATIDDFRDLKEDKKARFSTVGKIWQDGNNLVFSLIMKDAKPQSDKSKSIWLNDAVEIFFAPVTKDRRFTQFVVTCDGRKYLSNGSKEIKNGNWKVETKVMKNSWSTHIIIPFTLLGYKKIPPNGSLLAFNIGRQHIAPGQFPNKPNYNIGNRWAWGKMIDHSSWAYGYGQINRFGVMFLGSMKPYIKKQLSLVNSKELSKYKNQISPDAKIAYSQIKYLLEQERLLKLKKEKFIVAQIEPSTDTSLPFLPIELNNPQKSFYLRAAVNEKASLVLALANMTNLFEEYRVTLNNSWERNEPQIEYYYMRNGLKSKNGDVFPSNKITIRRGVVSRDSENLTPTRRYDILAKVNEISSVPVSPGNGSLIWITLDCCNVKPGIYTGYLNVTPLSFNRFISVKHKADGLLVKDTSTKKIPFTLEVLPIKLDDNTLPLNGFRGGVYQYHFDFMKDYNVCMHMVTPWYFTVKFNNDGSILKKNFRPFLEPHLKLVAKNIKNMPSGQRKVFLAYGAYDNFKKVHLKNQIPFNTPAYWNAWRNWCKVINDTFIKHGISINDYSIELADEPRLIQFSITELTKACIELKKAVPNVHVSVTNASDVYAKALGPHIDSWIFSQYEIYDKKRNINVASFCNKPKKEWSVYCCETQLSLDLYRYYRIHAWKALDINAHFLSIYEFYNQQPGIDFIRVLRGGLVYDTAHNLVPSVRLENLRIGIDDVRYLKYLENSISGNSKRAKEIKSFIKNAARDVVHVYPHDKSTARKMREKAIKYILEK